MRARVVAAANRLVTLGLTRGTSGNVSARVDGGFLITPSGVPCDQLTPDHVVAMAMDGAATGSLRPVSRERHGMSASAATTPAQRPNVSGSWEYCVFAV